MNNIIREIVTNIYFWILRKCISVRWIIYKIFTILNYFGYPRFSKQAV